MGIGTEMGVHGMVINSSGEAPVPAQAEDEMDLRRGPWTVEEDLLLLNYINNHGEGRWNSLARCAGLKRTGKSCRLRWLNYLRPDVRRGNITPEEQLLILELHSRWGNRWSKIAQHLPGRTDNEIKNYWRTRVQKHAKQLKCDVNSKQFKDVMRYLWMPRLMERIRAASSSSASATAAATPMQYPSEFSASTDACVAPAGDAEPMQTTAAEFSQTGQLSPDNSCSMAASSELSAGTHLSSPPVSDLTDCYVVQCGDNGGYVDEFPAAAGQMMCSGPVAGGCSETLLSPCGYFNQGFPDFDQTGWGAGIDFSSENLWGSVDDLWFLQQQL
ncbi:hypothetical protein Taro_013051 [Colocasia esculenta]|uniref:Uncharacterized protein n=1 Tax=Colocasia esculenta TaxID=4460 RepID=A0A843U5L2_COLES|nr:hypothetical protein [Colocasia esculenta]